MIRLLIVLACGLALAAPAALAQGPGGSGAEVNSGTCSGCGKVATWTGGAANAPKRCPHCRVRISSVDNDDGTQTDLDTGRTRAQTPTWVKVLIGLVVVGVLAVVGVVKVMNEERATRTGTRSKMSRAARERRREFEAEAASRRRPPPPSPEDDTPIRMADDGFEVVGDTPPVPAPVPPRRMAKPKLLPPE